MANPLKTRIQNGRATRALWLEAGSAVMAEAAIHAGFRFVLIDNEHGPASNETTAHMLRAIEAAGGHGMMRVPGNDPVLLKRYLELGVTSIMIPQINTAQEARAAVAACRYPPKGARGFAGDIRASRYGTLPDYHIQAHQDLCLMLQIESREGVENAQDIAAVDGVDMLFIGPYDLSGTYGHLGQTDHPEVVAGIERVEKVAHRAGRPLGTVPRAGKTCRDLLDAGYDLVISESEISLAMRAMRADIEDGDADWVTAY